MKTIIVLNIVYCRFVSSWVGSRQFINGLGWLSLNSTEAVFLVASSWHHNEDVAITTDREIGRVGEDVTMTPGGNCSRGIPALASRV